MSNLTEIRSLVLWNVDDPVVVKLGHGRKVYGRVTVLLGNDTFSPVMPMLQVTTPHGSIITAGIVWCHRPDNEELEILLNYEKMAAESKPTL